MGRAQLREEEKMTSHDDHLRAALKIALSGALTGGVIGAGGKFLTGARGLGAIGKAGAVGAGLGGAVSGLSNLLGASVMDEPEPGEVNGYAKRGLVGGGLLGAGIGGVLGGLGASGKLKISANAPQILRKIASMAAEELPLKNLIAEKIAQLGEAPTGAGIRKGALMGAATLGLPSAYMGMDESLGYDALQREIEDEQRKKMMEQYGQF
jgi:hypothetical protein